MRKKLLLFLLLSFPLVSFAQIDDFLVEEDPLPTTKTNGGLSYSLLETGSGLGLFYEIPVEGFMHLGASFDAFIIRDQSEFSYTDYYGYPRTTGKVNNVFIFDLSFSVKQRLFAYSFDDSFRPFVIASAGPVFGMNFPDERVTTKPNEYRWTFGGSLGAGIDADIDGKYFFGVRMQYRFLPFLKKLGERQNHSMPDIRIEFGQHF